MATVKYMVLLIDNYDSFTYNLYQQIAGLGLEVLVIPHDKISLEEVTILKPEKIVISPGPKRPTDAGISCAIIERFYRTIPILGVCLGHQCIGSVFGVDIVPAKEIVHGKTVEIEHTGSGLFAGITSPMTVARYHSLVVSTIPQDFIQTAWTLDGDCMAIQHIQYPLYGLQFHPESFMTPQGTGLMRTFIHEC